ncbi:MAG: hypothetical protein QOE23_3380 [Pseudonocardiales bacterium]|jgi:nitroreductase|nr:hypothetical protein [Pseudonocardiales bacterium]
MQPLARLIPRSAVSSGLSADALRRAAVRATWAPSVHNTQPWYFVIGRQVLEVHADLSRQLAVLDPTGRQLIISCGCAVFNARVSLAADGFAAEVRRHVRGEHESLLADLTGEPGVDRSLAALDPVLGLRRTNRRQFADDRILPDLTTTLQAAASAEGAVLCGVEEQSHRAVVARLSQEAEATELADAAYRAELRAWVTDDQRRGDGVSVATLPRLDRAAPGVGPAAGALPLRTFADPGRAGLPGSTRSSPDQSLSLLGTERDDPLSWLRAGEALERVWLEVTRAGYAMSLFTQIIEVPRTRELLRSELGLTMHPHILLRIGRAPATPASRRRKLVEMLHHAD